MTFDHTVISNTASTHRSGRFKSLTFSIYGYTTSVGQCKQNTHRILTVPKTLRLKAIFDVKILIPCGAY